MPVASAEKLPIAKADPGVYRWTLAAIFVGLTVAVVYSVWASHNGVLPCPLCIFQRMLFMGLIALAAVGSALPTTTPRVLLAAMVAISLGGLGVAVTQCWMQEFPESVTACGYGEPTLIEQVVDWAGVQLPYLFLATGFCEQKDIAMLGISWAQLSALAFLFVFMSSARLLSIFGRRPESRNVRRPS